MSNKAILILVVIILAATGYLLFKSEAEIDMGGEKHGAEAIGHGQDKPSSPSAAPENQKK